MTTAGILHIEEILLRAIAARFVFLLALPRSHSFMVAEAVKKPLKDGSPCMGTFPTWGKNQPLKVRNCRCPYSDGHSVEQDQILCKVLFCLVLDTAALLAGIPHMRQMFI
jgi:hypothetical protein